ncbi:BTAD domain-containing putative transcriptional regulator [Streptomyces sp. C10-9-1]|uniref:AfsR/SARP family transcriptional regulator n=1 Tax=Streptomyces sp. C10-9-1 TaxID=1859285 RepID=UPI003D725013
MRFQLLGPLSITDGRDVVVLPPSKPTSLLAALLVRPGEVVPAHRLRQAVWGEEQPATAKAALQSCVLRLRRLFAKYDIEEQAVVAVAGGYRLPTDGDTLDLLHFRRLADRAASAGEAELPLLREALGLWQGPLLANVPSELLHRDEVPRLVEERLRVLERVCEIQLARGRGREVLVDLWEATRTHPQHEGFAAQLMRALYRVGRQIEALAEYRRIRTRLREELGVDPGAELQALELAILRGDAPGGPALAATLTRAPHPSPAVPGAAPRTPAASAVRGPVNALPAPGAVPSGGESPAGALPAPGGAAAPVPHLPAVPGFTGRSRETAALAKLLGTNPGRRHAEAAPVLAVVSGGPGMGKTALALHTAQLVADRYPGGSVLVPLTGPDGAPRPGGEAAAALRAALPRPGQGPCLVVLDDVVHPDQVRELLDVPGCGAVVATSRMGLAALVATHAPGVLQLGALTAPESEALLTTVLGAERVGAEASAARELAQTCGHVPLALRIAAARLLTRPKLRLADYAAWLHRDLPARLALPDDPRMSVPLALDGALGRLPAPLAEAQLRLARCEGRITAAAAGSALSLAETDAEELLERLLDTGLLEEEQPGAFRMNPLFRAHALRRATRTAAGPSRSSAAARRALPSPAP